MSKPSTSAISRDHRRKKPNKAPKIKRKTKKYKKSNDKNLHSQTPRVRTVKLKDSYSNGPKSKTPRLSKSATPSIATLASYNSKHTNDAIPISSTNKKKKAGKRVTFKPNLNEAVPFDQLKLR